MFATWFDGIPISTSLHLLLLPVYMVALVQPRSVVGQQTPVPNARGYDSYDYVIVGGGTSGLVVANRLSADPSTRVAVIEAGGDARDNPNVTSVLGFLTAFGTPIDWAYPMVAQTAGLDGRDNITYHAGRALGGTSTINGMTFLRGDVAEVDAWERLGNPGWNWDALWPHYRGVERFEIPTDGQAADGGVTWKADYHGEAGDLTTGYPFELINGSVHELWQATWENLGISRNEDPNGGDIRGCSIFPSTVDRDADVREDAARAFLHPVEDRANLQIIQGTVTRIVWKEGTGDCIEASGVEYVTPDNKTVVLGADKEVILSAGALRSPPILEASGIGHPSILEPLGIETRVNLPGVGENMIEQPLGELAYGANVGNLSGVLSSYGAFLNAQDLFGNETASIAASTRDSLADWAASISAANGGLVDAAALQQVFEVQHDLIFASNVTIVEMLLAVASGEMAVVGWDLLPFSRGRVHLQQVTGADGTASIAYDFPAIDPKYLLADFDVAVMTAGGRLGQAYAAQEPIAGIVTSYIYPGDAVLPQNASDAQWEAVLRIGVTPNHHALGTAAMMSRELGGVVDPELRVYGTANVRVVDASIMPMQISGHLTSTLYAVADRAADIILGKI